MLPRRGRLVRWRTLLLVLGLLWVAYALSPYVALYRLSRAVQARDAAAVAERVNFRTLRLSLTRQALAAVGEAVAARHDLQAREREMLTHAAAALIEPLMAAAVTPEALTDLLDDGWPQQVAAAQGDAGEGKAGAPAAPPAAPPADRGFRAGSLAQIAALFATAEPRGFRSVVFAYPPDRPRQARFRLRLRLRGWSWRVVEIELPADLRDRLSQGLLRRSRASGPPPTGIQADGR